MFIQQGCSELNCWSGLGSATQFVCLGTEQLIPTYLPPKVKEEGLQMESLSWSTMDFYSSQWGQNNQTSQTDPFLLIGFVHITHSTRTISHDYNSHWNAPRTLFSLQPPSTFCSTLLLGCINCREAWRGVTGNQSCPGVYLGAAESWAPGPALATWFVSRAQPNQRTVLLLRSVHWGFQLESLVSGTMTCDLRETLRCLRLSLEPFPRCAIAFLLVEYPRRPNTFSSEFIYGFPCHFSGARLWTLAYNLLAVLMVFTQISPWGNCVRHLYRASSGNVMLSSLNTAAPAAPFWSEKAWKSLNQLDLLSDGRKSLLALWTSRQVSSAWASPQFHV